MKNFPHTWWNIQVLCKKIEASLYSLYWGFKRIPFTLYTCVLAKILQNGAKFMQKLTPGFKNHMRNLDHVRQAVESPKSLNSVGCFCPEYTSSAKTLYTEDLSNITFNYLCENSPNSSCHFSNKKSVFLKSLNHSSVLWEIILLYFSSWNFICYWQK